MYIQLYPVHALQPGRVTQSVGHLTRKSGVLGSIHGQATYFRFFFRFFQEGQLSVTGESISVGRAPGSLSQRSWVRYPVWQHTFVSSSAFSRRAVVSDWRKYVHEELVNRLGGLRLPRENEVRLTDRPDMTLDVYRGRKTTNYNNNNSTA